MTTYTPRHVNAPSHRGPTFEFATLACLWILHQAKPSEWSWEQLSAPAPVPAAPDDTLLRSTINRLRTHSGWWEGDDNAARVLAEYRSAVLAQASLP